MPPTTQSKDTIKLISGDAAGNSARKNPISGHIQFIGNESMKSIVRFNMDSYLLGLNTFETISMFDHVHQAMTGLKKKLSKVSGHLDSIEKKQTKLDANADKMIEKLKAFRELKREVTTLNRAQNRPSSKDPRNRNDRRGG